MVKQKGNVNMENRYNTLCIARHNFTTEDEYLLTIGKAIDMLQQNDYTIEIPRRECAITIIHYNYADPQMGTPMPYWLNPEEEETVDYAD